MWAALLLIAAQEAPPVVRIEPPMPMETPAPVSWERQVVNALRRAHRYPPEALHQEMQGTVFVRFRMNRAGQVLWTKLHRSSGYDMLDQEALASVARALLPPIPADRDDEVDLMLPVAFRIAE